MLKKIPVIVLISIALYACSNWNQQEGDDHPVVTLIPHISTEAPINQVVEATQLFDNLIVTESRNGITVAITWSYIDSYRLAFEVRINGIDAPVEYSLPCPIREVIIIDDQGYVYDNYVNDTGDTQKLSLFCIHNKDTNSFVATYNFYHQRPDLQQANVSIAVSLGNFNLYAADGRQTLLPDFGTYSFNLSVLVDKNLTINLNEMVEVAKAKTTLSRIEINPTIIVADICIEYEDNHGWYPETTLMVNNEKILPIPELTRWTNYNPEMDWYDSFTTFRCYKFTFSANLITKSLLDARNIVVSLDNLEINFTDAITENECVKLRNDIGFANPDLDFICHIDYRGGGYGFSFEVTKIPFGMTMERAREIIEDGFKKNISGPWVFSIALP